eukprot:6389803-Pyramimonas_sp.AAC.1
MAGVVSLERATDQGAVGPNDQWRVCVFWLESRDGITRSLNGSSLPLTASEHTHTSQLTEAYVNRAEDMPTSPT